MKPLPLILLFLVASALLGLSAPPKTTPPPGTIALSDSLFMDRCELSNLSWREYELWMELNDSNGSAPVLPDTSLFQKIPDMRGEGWSNYQYRHPGFSDYPVMGISHEQAEAFCRWRSDRVNELIATKRAPKDWKFKKVTYRLPTEAEWELAARGKLDTSFYYGIRNPFDPKKGPMINVVFPQTPVNVPRLPAPVKSFQANEWGLYHMCGNVAEMVAEPGLAKGGNFGLPLEECRISEKQYYDSPEPWLGFRCVATIER